MKQLDALKEALTDEAYQNEPLAQAIMLYLNKRDPQAHSEILELFEKIIATNIDRKICNVSENEEACEIIPASEEPNAPQ